MDIIIGPKYNFKPKNEVEEKYFGGCYGVVVSADITMGKESKEIIDIQLIPTTLFAPMNLIWRGNYREFCRDWELEEDKK